MLVSCGGVYKIVSLNKFILRFASAVLDHFWSLWYTEGVLEVQQ